MEIRFYDNEKKNWDNDMKIHSDEVEYFDVDEETPYKRLNPEKSYKSDKAKKYDLNKQYINLFLDENNTYAMFLDSALTHLEKNKSDKTMDKIIGKDYPTNGIDDLRDELMKWTETNTTNKVVLFDWDRTITTVEGLFTEQLNEKILNNEIKIHDIAVYIMGGEERLKMYKEMFDHFSKHKMAFFILTHNPNASKRSPLRQLYIDIIHEVANANTEKIMIDTDILLCSSDHCYKKHISACATVLKKYLEKCKQLSPSYVKDDVETNKLDDVSDKPKVKHVPKVKDEHKVKDEPKVKDENVPTDGEDEKEIIEEPKVKSTKRKRESMIDDSKIVDDSEIIDVPPLTASRNTRSTRKRKMITEGGKRKTQRRKTRKYRKSTKK
jgi:hypothetical protein